MIRLKFYLWIVFILLIFADVARALPENYGISAFETDIGARSKSMGGAFSTVYENGDLSFSNPACNTAAKGLFLSLSDMKNILAFQFLSVFDGIAGIGLVTNDAPLTTVEGNSVSYTGSYAVITYAKEIYGASFGMNLKLLLSQTYQVGSTLKTGTGWDADIGLMKKIYPWATLGIVAQNLLPSGTLGGGKNSFNDNTSDSFSMALRLGASAKIFGSSSLFFESDQKDLLIAADIELYPKSNTPALLHAGLEWSAAQDNFVRLGLDQHMFANAVETSFTFGGGIRSDSWNIDAFFSGRSDRNKNGISFYYFSPEAQAMDRSFRPFLKVFSPSENFVTDADKIIVSGECRAISVKINGANVFINKNGQFSAQAPLYVGKNLIQIVASTPDGELEVQRRVLRKIKIVLREEEKISEEKQDIQKDRQSMLEKEISLAAIEAKPVKTEKEKAFLIKEKKRLAAEKMRIEAESKRINSADKIVRDKKVKIEALATLGIIKPPKDNVIKTEEKITRAELSVWLVKARGFPVPKISKAPFRDVAANYWAAPYIAVAAQKGLVKPLSDGLFHPEEGLSRSEGAEILKRFDKGK